MPLMPITHGGEHPDQFDVLLAIARLEGKFDAVLTQQGRQEATIGQHTGELAQVRERVIALETARKSTTPWHTTLGAVLPSIALLLVVAERLYGK